MRGRSLALTAALGVIVVTVLLLVGPVHNTLFGSSGGSKPTAAPTPSASVLPRGDVKPVIRGLIDRQGPPPTDLLGEVHAYVIKVNWADLQPTPGGPIAPDNAIDKAIARVRQPDFVAAGVVLKLRVFAGVDAPQWAKTLGGAPVTFANNQAGGSVSGGTIGRFWTPQYEQAYAQLESELAAKYDDVPEIREVTVAGCSTLFDELFVRQLGVAANTAALKAAGYTTAADEQCIKDAITAHGVWAHTTSDVDFSPFPTLTDTSGSRDLAFTESMMSFCRSVLGVRCGLENNALSSSKLATAVFAQMYAQMHKLGAPIILQTAATSRIGDESHSLAAAVTLGANSVELPQGYQKWPVSLLQTTAAGLAANPAP